MLIEQNLPGVYFHFSSIGIEGARAELVISFFNYVLKNKTN